MSTTTHTDIDVYCDMYVRAISIDQDRIVSWIVTEAKRRFECDGVAMELDLKLCAVMR
jgi:hypothetical protein